MARLALAAAGYGIGFAIGGPLGGQIGWAAGSFVGALVSAEDVVNEGPRLTDRSQAGADYGLGIKWVLGTTRVAGQLIWQEPIAEHRHEETESAKGGPDVTTVTKRLRRVFEFSVHQLQEAATINGATQIALNFANYLDWSCYGCKEYRRLPRAVHDFIAFVEDAVNLRVSVIGTGPQNDHVILRDYQ